MPRRIRVVTWNGKDVPAEFLELPTGRYVVELVEEAPVLTPEEEAGIEAALESYRRGRVVYPCACRNTERAQVTQALAGLKAEPESPAMLTSSRGTYTLSR